MYFMVRRQSWRGWWVFTSNVLSGRIYVCLRLMVWLYVLWPQILDKITDRSQKNDRNSKLLLISNCAVIFNIYTAIIHPSIIAWFPLLGRGGGCSPSQLQKQTSDKSPARPWIAYNKQTTILYSHSPIPWTHIVRLWEKARGPWENPSSHRENMQTSRRKSLASRGTKPRTFLLWGDSANRCTTHIWTQHFEFGPFLPTNQTHIWQQIGDVLETEKEAFFSVTPLSQSVCLHHGSSSWRALQCINPSPAWTWQTECKWVPQATGRCCFPPNTRWRWA